MKIPEFLNNLSSIKENFSYIILFYNLTEGKKLKGQKSIKLVENDIITLVKPIKLLIIINFYLENKFRSCI